MNKLHKYRLEAFDRLGDLLEDHPLAPAIPRVTVLQTQVTTSADTLRLHAAAQVGGGALYISGTASRAEAAREVRVLMQPINRIARSLNRQANPGVREKFRMPENGRYETLISTARSFVEALAVAGVKALFTDRGLAATFDTDLTTKVDALVAITEIKYRGLIGKVGATQGVGAASLTGLQAMRELEAILKNAYAGNPVLLAELKSACHVQRDLPKKKEPVAAAAPTVTGSGGTAAPGTGGAPVSGGSTAAPAA